MKVGLLLEGGAMRGMYTVGALDCLMKKIVKEYKRCTIWGWKIWKRA